MFRRVDYTAEELFTVVKQAILDAKEHTSELYLDVKPDIGFSVAEWLDADEEVKEIRHRSVSRLCLSKTSGQHADTQLEPTTTLTG